MKKTLFLAAIATIFSFSITSISAQTNWVNLFDGKTLNGWKLVAGTAIYTVENGAIVGTSVAASPNSFLISEKEYGDFVLEMDVKLRTRLLILASNSAVNLMPRVITAKARFLVINTS